MSQSLPDKPSLVHLRKQAKDLLASYRSGDSVAVATVTRYFASDRETVASEEVGLVEAQLVLAREYGFESWSALRRQVDKLTDKTLNLFIGAACSDRYLEAKSMWREHRSTLRLDVVAAVVAGDVSALQEAIAGDPSVVRDPFGPKDAPLICYACISRLVADPDFEKGILDSVSLLLRSGADPDAYTLSDWGGEKWRESALYGAAGLLNHAGLTKLLLDAGADPNDNSIEDGVYRGEALYHACDHPGRNECLRLLLEANPAQVAADYCLKRKLDFEDREGVQLFLDHGTNPNANRPRTALSHAILRGRSLGILQLLLDAGADPNLADEDGTTAYVLARRLANREASALLEAYGAQADFGPYDAILIAAADGDEDEVRRLVALHPDVVSKLSEFGRQDDDGGLSLGSAGQILHDMARLGHSRSVRVLLELGMDPGLRNQYNETPLHWACLAGRFEVAKLLTDFGAPLDIREENHHCTPIEWAYWGSEYWNEPFGNYGATVEVMLEAGSSLPTKLSGNEVVRSVLRAHGVQA